MPEFFVPFPKNSLIAKFFIQLGRVDELGSGVLNVYRFLKYYSPGQQPQFIEDKLFKTVIPIGEPTHEGHEIPTFTTGDAVNDAVSIQVRKRLTEELKLIQKQGGVTFGALIATFDIKRATGQRDIKQLKDAGLIIFSGADRSGKYILTEKGKELFSDIAK